MTSSGVPPDHECLEVSRRLEDLQVGFLDDAVADPHMERALALDAGQVLDLETEVTPVAHPDLLRCLSRPALVHDPRPGPGPTRTM